MSLLKNIKKLYPLIRPLTALAIGATLPLVVILIILYRKGVLNEFIDAVLLYNLDYSRNYYRQSTNFIYFFLRLSFYWLTLYLLTIYFYVTFKSKRFFYLGLVISSLIFIYRSPICHHYIQLIPFLSLISSASVVKLLRGFSKHYLKFIFICVIFSALTVPNIKHIFTTPRLLNLATYGPGNPFMTSFDTAQKVASLTDPDDTVLIYGHEPQILYYSKRKSASRFIYGYHLIIPTKYRAEYEDEYVNDLLKNKPKIVVYSPNIKNINHAGCISYSLIKRVDEILAESYEVVFSSIPLNGKDPLQNGSLPMDSLVLYIKKS